jgi:hypothetical protein
MLVTAALLSAAVDLVPQPASPITTRGLDAGSPPCASIPVELLDPIDSAHVRTGETFRFRTIEAITPRGFPAIPIDAVGYGIVEHVESASGHGKNGQVILEPRYIMVGAKQRVDVTIDIAATVVRSGSSRTFPALPLPYIGMGASAFNYFHAGKNIVLDAGLQFDVRPIDDLSTGLTCRMIKR